ncbi:hypothetical protein [uncultured Cohaesibacter sp.]|uniref:hypothetical protein n=1 Tax=uncultured Cohaesibacter sp. TaxID=1002546 RepID=UPI0029C8ABB0|nr:hypothetical protein [uncultured Cohaesibacter sp.]
MKRPTSGGSYVRSKKNGSLKKADGSEQTLDAESVPSVKSKLSSDSETTEEGN